MFASEMRGLDSALNLPLCCPAQVRDQFFALVDTMFKKLNQRSQDPEDSLFNKFPWDSLGLVPPSQIYNMDEMGVDTNKSRKKKAAKKEAATDHRQQAQLFEETYGTTTRSTSLAVLLPAPMAATASPPSSSTPTPTAPQTSHGLLRSACADSAQYHMLLCHYKQISKLADKQRPRALLQALGEHLPRGEWPVGQPHWHRRRRHQEGLHDQGRPRSSSQLGAVTSSPTCQRGWGRVGNRSS